MCLFQELKEHTLNYTRKYVNLSVWQARLPNEIFAFFGEDLWTKLENYS